MVGSADPEPGCPGLAHPEPRIHGSQPWLWAFVFFPEDIGDGGRRGASQAALSVRQAAHHAGARAVLPVLEGHHHSAVLKVPPLRNRREDIEILVDHFRKQANLQPGSGLDIDWFTDEALTVLARDEWPGNVRELDAVVRRAMIRRRHGWVTATDIVFPKLRRKGIVEAVVAS